MQVIYPLNNHWLAQTSYTVRGMSKTVSSKTNNVTVHWQLLGQINQEHQKAGTHLFAVKGHITKPPCLGKQVGEDYVLLSMLGQSLLPYD